jgi:Mn-dependent DtxR family transcriptional regulator
VPGEISRPTSDDSDLKQPLQKHDLMPPSHAGNPDYDEAKERYEQRLEDILNTPLVPENFSTYAQDALNKVIGMVEHMTETYPGQSLPLPRGIAEDFTTKYYNMDIDDLLDTLQKKVDETNEIEKFVESLGEYKEVYVPPQILQPGLRSGTGEFSKAETSPKLETILFLLQERYELDINNTAEIIVTKGKVSKDMMRQEPYYLIDMPTLNRKILVCNEKGNITYVLDSELLDTQNIEPEVLVDMDKSQIDELIKDNENIGARITHTTKYIPKIEEALDSIEEYSRKTEGGIDNDDSIKDESLLTEKPQKAPEGYMSVFRISKEMKISNHTVSKLISELGDELGEVSKARFGTRIFDSYSPEQIEMIRARAEEEGLFTTEAPEGYMSVRQISKELGMDGRTILSLISELGDELGEVSKARFGVKSTDSYSPEQIEMIRARAEEQGLFTPEAPEGYMSAKKISKELGIGNNTVSKLISELSDELGEVSKARFGTTPADSYSPAQIEMIRARAEEQGLTSPEAPEGYMSVKKISEELGITNRTVSKLISELGDELGGVSKARFGVKLTDSYSPEQIGLIRARAEEQGLFTPEAPEGYMSLSQTSKEVGIARNTVSKIISELGNELGEVGKARFGSRLADSYSPEQIEMIRKKAIEKGYIKQ